MTHNNKILCLAVSSILAGNAFAMCNYDEYDDDYDSCMIMDPCAEQHSATKSARISAPDETPPPITCNTGTGSSQALFDITNASFDSVNNRIDTLRDADLIGFAPAALTSMQANNDGIASGILVTKAIKHGIWAKTTGTNARQDMRGGFDGYKSRSAGVTLGADTRLDNDMVVGGAFTFIDTAINMKDASVGSGSDIDSYQGTGYLSRDYGTWHMDALLAYTKQRTQSHRLAGGDTMIGKFSSDLISTRVTAGKRLPMNNSDMIVTPFVSLQYDHLKQDGYTETGGPAALTVNRTTASRLTSGLGARMVTNASVAGRQIKPSVTAQWLHEFKQEGLSTSGTVGGGGAFVNQGQKAVKNMLGLGTSVMVPVGRNAAISIGYNYEGASKYQNHGYELVYNYWF